MSGRHVLSQSEHVSGGCPVEPGGDHARLETHLDRCGRGVAPRGGAFGIVLTRVDTRKSRTNAAVFAALGPWNPKILGTVIPQSEPLNQAQMERKDIFLFDPASAGAVAYRELINELQSL